MGGGEGSTLYHASSVSWRGKNLKGAIGLCMGASLGGDAATKLC
jgi:hypothetical protein